ncbi:hypothetical protein ACRTAL_000263 [Clostridium perfringens]|uniref:hypothetical protein n=3 Tax=Clostridium perfringens TaxID=1502 RepID=UPI001A229DCA|nr:hypothetical protein [Clostridium perfringens]MDU7574462.1 hypothetical protein [Clostridioides difficile]EHK2402859.1 hypothetical protein [Clostridium perfringens]MDH2470747.1 hypothetical protein [Clostridium perfringens]MDM0890036.1 hypothetical protein [Clostridium perfringens]MDM0894012.1 hypothetical protein [Clostridium perfringens]
MVKGNMFIKFFKCEAYRDDLVNGKLYMNTNVDFSKRENKEVLSNGQYDGYEGTQLLLNPDEKTKLVVKEKNGKMCVVVEEKEDDNDISQIRNVQLGRLKNINYIYCMYTLGILENNDILEIEKIDDRILQAFGNYFVLILNMEEFLKRVKLALGKNGFKEEDFNRGQVKYKKNNGGAIRLGTYAKFDLFEYQKEFRISIKTNKKGKKDYIVLDIGDISDIIVYGKINDISDICIKDNKLIIG